MNFQDLLYKRVLIATKEQYRNTSATVSELLIMEVSPSGSFVKVRDMDGRKFWKLSSDIIPIEILSAIETAPKF